MSLVLNYIVLIVGILLIGLWWSLTATEVTKKSDLFKMSFKFGALGLVVYTIQILIMGAPS